MNCGRGVGTDLERGYGGWAALKTPFSSLSRSSQGSHFNQKSLKVSSQDSLFRKKITNLTPTASIFVQILALRPPNLKISVHKTSLLVAKISLQAPHLGNPCRTPLPEKGWVPPPGGGGEEGGHKLNASWEGQVHILGSSPSFPTMHHFWDQQHYASVCEIRKQHYHVMMWSFDYKILV